MHAHGCDVTKKKNNPFSVIDTKHLDKTQTKQKKMFHWLFFFALCIYEYFNSITHNFCLSFFLEKNIYFIFLEQKELSFTFQNKMLTEVQPLPLWRCSYFLTKISPTSAERSRRGTRHWPFRHVFADWGRCSCVVHIAWPKKEQKSRTYISGGKTIRRYKVKYMFLWVTGLIKQRAEKKTRVQIKFTYNIVNWTSRWKEHFSFSPWQVWR